MFDDLIQKLDGAIRAIRNTGKLNEKNIGEALRGIQRALLEADVHFKVVKEFISAVREKAVGTEVTRSVSPGQQVVKVVHDELVRLLGHAHVPIAFSGIPPSVILIVGLQGSGKTTFAAKLGALLRKSGRDPMLVAADIYRPAAIKQLATLGKGINLPVFEKGTLKPVLICKAAVEEARKQGKDTLIVDTAGRLHIDDAMMAELEALKSALHPSEILYVADGMTGQDAVKSAQAFLDRLDFNGIVLTKMDGDSRGGAALSIRAVTGRPIKFISNGEKTDAVEPFHPERMASRILGMGDVVTLVEKAQEAVDHEQAEKLAKKLRKESFTLDDFYDQLQQVKKMGPMDQVLSMLPGAGRMMKQVQPDEKGMARVEAMIHSMTREERRKPHLINGSRRKRIASGSGTTVQDVNRLLKQFQMMQKMIRQMGRMNTRGMMNKMPFSF
ncbi:signal recognition particle protein [bacterium]|nr:signal recognition particle protein [bacterium]